LRHNSEYLFKNQSLIVVVDCLLKLINIVKILCCFERASYDYGATPLIFSGHSRRYLLILVVYPQLLPGALLGVIPPNASGVSAVDEMLVS